MYYQFKKSQTIIFSSGELAQLLSVTTQTIMNYRKRGMPYCSMTLWGYYEYNFDAIQWVFDNSYKEAKIKELPFAYRYKLTMLQVENKRLKELLYPKVTQKLPLDKGMLPFYG